MCHGSVDPRYLIRDIEARVKPLAFVQPAEASEPSVPLGLMARLMALFGVLRPTAQGRS